MKSSVLGRLTKQLAGVAVALCGASLWLTAAPAHAAAAMPNTLPLRELYTQPGQMYLYSSSWPEVSAARTSYGLTLANQRPVGYILTTPSSDTIGLYRLQQKTTGNWIESDSQSEINALVNGGQFTLQGLSGYLYTSASHPNTQLLYRYNNGRGWRVALSSQAAAMKSAGYTQEGPLGYILTSSYQVGAYYFGTYDNGASPALLQAVLNYFGRYPDPWGGVRDFSGQDPAVKQNTQGWTGDWSYLKPSIGYYDDSQPSTLQKQIDQAANAGLTYFSFYEYWNNQANTAQLDSAVKAFTQAPNSQRLNFMLSVVIPTETGEHISLPTSQFAAAADNFSEYTKQPNYLVTQDGRPMVFMEDTAGIGSGSIQDRNSFIDLLKQDIKAKTGRDAFLMNNSDSGIDTVSQIHGDGYSCLNITKYINDGSYSEYVGDLGNYFAGLDKTGLPTSRCAISGFNEAPRTGFLLPKSSIRYFKDNSKTQFSQAMATTKTSMVQQPASPIDNYVTVYAWNEWLEGGIIEPNVRDGSYYLNTLQSTFSLVGR
ncbi:MAG TPA: glycoside hydrolase family 99-like domain-containing protein [Candidatus Saccharimonadia bacterium]|nr:glycoside hydrolase family 99-like domain-containing protein [Candidatus Saccharimonadia bacterium]